MMLWVVIAGLTLVVVGVVLAPLLRWSDAPRSRAAQELTIYRDQLAEVRRDAERGLLAPEEAEAAEIEIKRKILAADARQREAADKAKQTSLPRALRAWTAAVAAILLPAGALSVYLALGSPHEPGRPLSGERWAAAGASQPVDADTAALIRQLADRMKERPDDLTGWLLLARSYMAQGQYAEGADAYREAFRLDGKDPEIAGAFAEALVQAAGGMVVPEAALLFEQLHREQPTEPRARYYLGLAKAQSGDGQGALQVWLALQADAPPDAPWLPAVREQIAATAQQFGIDVGGAGGD